MFFALAYVCLLLHLNQAIAECPEDWKRFEDSCYHFFFDEISWNEAQVIPHFVLESSYKPGNDAQERCASSAPTAHLVEINSYDENQFLVDHQGHNLQGYHIGGTDRNSEGVWYWYHSGQPMDYTNWHEYEPNDEYGEDCSEMESDGGWNDIPCTSVFQRFICEVDYER